LLDAALNRGASQFLDEQLAATIAPKCFQTQKIFDAFAVFDVAGFFVMVIISAFLSKTRNLACSKTGMLPSTAFSSDFYGAT